MKNFATPIFKAFLALMTISMYGQELPDFILPPEDAFQFTKYGDVPVNESSGRINLNIPLLTYEAGDLKLPLSLSYMGNGVKVNQSPSRTGMNWILQAGGVITRIVKSLPDDPYQNYYLSNPDLSAMDIQYGTGDAQLLNTLTVGGNYDTERDQFNFSFPGYSGSFFFDDNFNPVVVDRSSNLKIEVEGIFTVNEKINITTPDGTKYFFGGQETGISRLRDNTGNELVAPATTAYYLYKIENLSGDIIFFEYDQYGKQELTNLTQKITYEPQFSYNWNKGNCIITQNPDGSCESCTTDQFNMGCFECPKPNFTDVNPQNLSQVFNQSINKKLKRIYSSSATREVVLNDSPYGSTFQLNSITYKNNSQIINKVNLDYLEPNIGNFNRFFLEEVIQYNHLGSSLDNQKQIYKMEYNSPEDLPNQFAYSQDYYGYYNAKQNTTFIPKNDHYYFSQYNGVLADRSVVFNEAQKGSLKKITYPTRGHTLFEYEAPRVIEDVNEEVTLSIYHNDLQLIPDYDHVDQHISGSNAQNDVFGDQDVEFKIKIDLQPGYVEKHLKIVLTIEDLTNSTTSNHNFSLGTATNTISEPTTIIHDLPHTLIDTHEYKFRLTFSDAQYMDNLWATINARAFFKYAIGEQEVDGHGIRIKKVTNYTKESDIANIMRYYYKQAKNINTLNTESIVINPNPPSSLNIYSAKYYELCNIGLLCYLNFIKYDVLEYNSSQGGFPGTDNQAHYKYVTVSYGGDNFENGGTEKKFYFSGGNTYSVYMQPLEYLVPHNIKSNIYGNLDFQNGKLLSESIIRNYKTAIDPLRIVKKSEFIYDHSSYQFLPNFVGDRIVSCEGFDNVNNLLLGSYSVSSFNNHILEQKTTEYTDPVPIDILDDSIYNKLITTVNYEYGELAGLPIKTIRNSSDEYKEITRIVYPYQIQNASTLNLSPSLTNAELLAIDKLKSNNEHRVALPIQIESYIKNGNNVEKMTSAIRNTYKTFPTGLTDLEKVLTSKNSFDFEERIVYHNYDSKSKPVWLSEKDGTNVVYLWSSIHNKPLSKIVNANYDQVQNATGDLRVALPNAQVSTYTYTNHLNLLSSVTDPRGYTLYYHYDDFNRLKFVKDRDGNILSENEYNYRPQQN